MQTGFEFLVWHPESTRYLLSILQLTVTFTLGFLLVIFLNWIMKKPLISELTDRKDHDFEIILENENNTAIIEAIGIELKIVSFNLNFLKLIHPKKGAGN